MKHTQQTWPQMWPPQPQVPTLQTGNLAVWVFLGWAVLNGVYILWLTTLPADIPIVPEAGILAMVADIIPAIRNTIAAAPEAAEPFHVAKAVRLYAFVWLTGVIALLLEVGIMAWGAALVTDEERQAYRKWGAARKQDPADPVARIFALLLLAVLVLDAFFTPYGYLLSGEVPVFRHFDLQKHIDFFFILLAVILIVGILQHRRLLRGGSPAAPSTSGGAAD